jgi:hypothetical protein
MFFKKIYFLKSHCQEILTAYSKAKPLTNTTLFVNYLQDRQALFTLGVCSDWKKILKAPNLWLLLGAQEDYVFLDYTEIKE